LGKSIAHGKNRNDAINKLKRALDEIIIDGVATTVPFFQLLLRNKDFLAGNYYTNFIEKSEILREMICNPEIHKQFEINLLHELKEEELVDIVFQIYKNLKKEEGKKTRSSSDSNWKISNRLKMM